MKNTNKQRILGLSLVTAMLLGSSAYAGLIKTDAGDPADASLTRADGVQYGFGGWNFDNVKVKITDLDYNEISNTFDMANGTYGAMAFGDSFESEIKDINYSTGVPVIGTTVMGRLHGKDWPVGEPAGIKIINGDTATQHGKPNNCIMTSSYLPGGDLDDATPLPVICSSDFQSHKRYKINLLPSSIEGVSPGSYGKAVDLVFNLDVTDLTTEDVRYQVLQKVNNYTGKRLAGYKVEVLDENGSVNSVLNLSVGAGEGDDGADIWGPIDMANMSHGLWGAIDNHFDEPGFFDDERAYYPVTLMGNTISYAGDMQGSANKGNYQTLFGNWLPSVWEPTAIFWDHDEDANTDALLKAYWGDPLKTGTNSWHKGFVDNWVTPTSQEFLQWATDPAYETGGVEDVLNLGLNYIINVGENAKIGTTFILRVTPYLAPDQKPPVHVDGSGTPIPVPPIEEEITDGTVAISPAPTFTVGTPLILSVKDEDQNTDASAKDTTTVTVTSNTGDEETVTLTETEVSSSIFTALLATETSAATPVAGDGKMTVLNGSVVTVSYADDVHSDTASTIAVIPTADTDEPVDSSGATASSGGGGCTYNQNSKSFDMMFLLIAALGLLYPFRRKLFAKQA